MSLINKMLQDLDQRSGTTVQQATSELVAGLHNVDRSKMNYGRVSRYIGGILLVILGLSAVGNYFQIGVKSTALFSAMRESPPAKSLDTARSESKDAIAPPSGTTQQHSELADSSDHLPVEFHVTHAAMEEPEPSVADAASTAIEVNSGLQSDNLTVAPTFRKDAKVEMSQHSVAREVRSSSAPQDEISGGRYSSNDDANEFQQFPTEEATTFTDSMPAVVGESPPNAGSMRLAELRSSHISSSDEQVLDVEMQDSFRITSKSEAANRAKTVEQTYFTALEHYKAHRLADAEQTLKDVLQLQPKHIKAREMLYQVFLQQGHWNFAEQLLINGINEVPAYTTFSKLLARLYVEQGEYDQALLILEGIRNQADTDVEYLGFIAVLYQQNGQHDHAAANFQKALAIRPNVAEWWLGYALSLEGAGKYDEAKAGYLKARSYPQLSGALVKYAEQRLQALGAIK